MPGRLAFHLSGNTAESFHQQIEKVPSDAVDRKKAQVMDVEIPFRMRPSDFGGIDFVQPVDLADLGGDVVVQSLQGVIHIAVFVNFPIHLL